MAYQKRRSTILEKAQTRLRGLQSVNPTLDLGNGLTLKDYADLIESSDSRLQTHNAALAEADRTRIEFSEIEASVSALSSRILSAVAAMYGKDSKEYEMAGGKPPSRYNRVKKQVSATASSGTLVSNSSQNMAVSNGASINHN
ncbi:MAG: hypothetical protein KME16_10285 [Scytolyngbya sp. HA4215-MV1]|jgi:hypothetical protein|nr:hypothetical protein [Scytolyngbya sp. HA4215-MV1]